MIPRRFFWLFDFLILGLAFLAAYSLVPQLAPLFAPDGPLWTQWLEALTSPAIWSGQMPPLVEWLWVFLVMAPATLLILEALGNYGPLLFQSRTRIVAGSFVAPLASLSLVTLVLFALKHPDWSRLFTFSFTFLSGVGLGLYRLVLRGYFQHRRAAGYYAKNILLVGLPASLGWMAQYFAEQVPTTDYRLLGYLCVCSDQVPPRIPSVNEGDAGRVRLKSLGNVEELGSLLISRPIHEVIAIHPAAGGTWIEQVIRDCDYMSVLLRIVPEALLLGERHTLHTLYPFEPLHLPAVVLAPPNWDSAALFLKRLFDIAVSAALLVLLMPLFALIAVVIKITTPHLPVLYPWHVVGNKGVRFTGYKFTTMVADADERKAELMSQNEMTGPVFKIKDDPRVTPLGRFLRKYSLNELPQLWSVLKGDMSLVGPRPAGPHELERYEFWHKRKLSIRPGITCLWQIRGRNKISNFDDWVRMDLEYIDNWSLWLDVRILVRTAWAVIAGTGS
jgi:exopolysaccharide biosynthesis polyprenyl glycosylphosphotransferase